ncbi:MAG: L,D-transpeptidase [Myxococcota bacterium]
MAEARIAAIGPHVFIWPKPNRKRGVALGNIRMGTSVRVRDPGPVAGPGCARGYVGVVPRGYVCLDHRTTLDLDDPYVRALADVAPRPDALYPFDYAYSRGAPMYSRVPSPEEWRRAERRLGPPGQYLELGAWAAGHEELLAPDEPIRARDAVPWYFAGGRRHVGGGTREPRRLVWKTIPNGSMLAYAKAFAMHGRVWLVTPDLTLVPADRVQRIERTAFAGVALGASVSLPLGWNRTKKPQPLFRRTEDGGFEATGETIGPKAWVEIGRPAVGPSDDRYHPLRARPGVYLRARHSTFTWPRRQRPAAIREGEKWIDARIGPGTLTAYRGLEPVYATLFSPGKGGAPVPGLDHTKYATTQTGYFRFEWKERVATMSNEPGEPKILWFSDVPHIQYIRAPLALHVAYWHADYANPKSAECVNVSPRDGAWLFSFTDPPLPEGWGAVRPGGGFGRSTPIMINGM